MTITQKQPTTIIDFRVLCFENQKSFKHKFYYWSISNITNCKT